MSLQALLGKEVQRILEARSLEELKQVLYEMGTSARPVEVTTPLILNNRTNGPAIKIVNTGRDDQVGIQIQDSEGRQVQVGIGLGNRGLVANEIIPDRNYAIDPTIAQAHYSGKNVGAGYTGQQGFWRKLTDTIKGGWARMLDSYHLSLKTWHPPNTADQYSLNGNRKWLISDPCGYAIVHCRIKTVNADTLTCEVIDDGSGNGPASIIGSTITVCKPQWLMRTPFDGQTIDGITYTYSDHQHRQANNGITTENQVVHPLYKGNDVYGNPSEIYARWSCNGTDAANVWYIDVNADARTWVVA
jgi:hypothetical protein